MPRNMSNYFGTTSKFNLALIYILLALLILIIPIFIILILIEYCFKEDESLKLPQRQEVHPLHVLRGILAYWVYYIHYPFIAYKSFGAIKAYLAVDGFFILSGFILAFCYINTFVFFSKKLYLKFIMARVARIWPLIALTSIFHLIVHFAINGDKETRI